VDVSRERGVIGPHGLHILRVTAIAAALALTVLLALMLVLRTRIDLWIRRAAADAARFRTGVVQDERSWGRSTHRAHVVTLAAIVLAAVVIRVIAALQPIACDEAITWCGSPPAASSTLPPTMRRRTTTCSTIFWFMV